MKKYVTFFETIAILLGTVVGAGIFGLPYAFAKIGYMGGMIYLIFLGFIVLVTNLCFGEMVLRTNEALGVSGYVKKYLGQRAWWIMGISLLLGLYSALVAYIVAFSKFATIIFAPIFGGHGLIYAIIFWIIGSYLIMRGSKIMARAELGMTTLLILMTLLVFIFSLNYINPENYKGFNLDNLFYPYGIVLFALGGLTAVPTMRKILGNDANLMRSALVIGGLIIPILVYAIFTFSVVGVTGSHTSEEAISGLVKIMGPKIVLTGALFGLLSVLTSFVSLGYALRQFFHRDHKIPLVWAGLLAVSVPMILFLLGLNSFIKIIGFAGGIIAGTEGILIIMAFYKAKHSGDRSPEYNFALPKFVAYLIYLVFVLGIIYQLIYL